MKLAFKPDTDYIREAPARGLMEALWEHGAKVKAFDPEAIEECARIYGERSDLTFLSTKEGAVDGADALVICTEWKHFRAINYEMIKSKLATPVIFDGRNLYEPSIMRNYGIEYFAIGRL